MQDLDMDCHEVQAHDSVAPGAPMREAAISVAMATCNGGQFLQEQLDSLARQTLLPCELVVCDDGSTDDTLEILRRFALTAPFPVHIFLNQARIGFGFNFLKATNLCSGDLIAFCDQDDIWKEHKLKVCAETMRDPRVALVSHSGQVFSSQPLSRRWRRPDHRLSVWKCCRDIPTRRWELHGFSMVLRRTVLDKVPVPKLNAAVSSGCTHDSWATIAALSCGHVVLLPDELVFCRLHEGNTTLRQSAAEPTHLAPNPRQFERGAGDKARLAEFLTYAASYCNESVRGTFYEYIHQLERTGRLWSQRAQLHNLCGQRFAAATALFRMLAGGAYSPRGLGPKALVRDSILAAFWPAC